MSGTGKSTVLTALAREGHRVIDTDRDGWAEEVPLADGSGWEQLWREDRMSTLLAQDDEGPLFVSGCASNQSKYYDRFDAVVLLTATRDVLIERPRPARRIDSARTRRSETASSRTPPRWSLGYAARHPRHMI